MVCPAFVALFAVSLLVGHATPPNAFGRKRVNGDPTNTQITPAGIRVFRISGPPPSDTTDFTARFIYGPITDAVSRPWEGNMQLSTDTQVGRWELIWSDRNTRDGWEKRPNDTMAEIFFDPNADPLLPPSTPPKDPRIRCRTQFYHANMADPDYLAKGYRRAIGSTLVKTAYSAGLQFWNDPDHPDGKGWGQIAEEYGYNVDAWKVIWNSNPNHPVFTMDENIDTGEIVHHAFAADPGNIPCFFPIKQNIINPGTGVIEETYQTSLNQIILGPSRLTDIGPMARGFYLDHQHADDRSEALELQYIQELAKIVHAKKVAGLPKYQLHVTGHAANSILGGYSGITLNNAWKILQAVDAFTIVAGNATNPVSGLQAQYDFFKGPTGTEFPNPSPKLTMQPALNGMTMPDAQTIRSFIIAKSLKLVFIPTGDVPFGGGLTESANERIAIILGLPLASTITPPANAPAMPAGAAVAPSKQPVFLKWNVVGSIATPHATSYEISRSVTSGSGYAVLPAGSNVVGNSFTDDSVSPSTTYHYVVKAKNFGGTSASYSDPLKAVATTSSALVPPIPKGVAATAEPARILLSWTASSGATSYKVNRSDFACGPYLTVATPTSNSHIDASGIVDDRKYYYVISAVNATGESLNSAEVSQIAKSPAAPLTLDATAAGTSQISLAWSPVLQATGYNIKGGYACGPFMTITTVPAGTTSYTDINLSAGTTYSYTVSALNAGGEGYNSKQASATTVNPFANGDIGPVGFAGSANLSEGQYTVNGSGAFIWSGGDAFNFHHRAVSGNHTIIAKVMSVENTDGWAEAGVMIRESLSPNSPHAFMAVSAANGLAFARRTVTSGSTVHTRALGLSAPYWVKLERVGSIFNGYRSADGITWILVDSATINMGTAVYVGLAVTAHDNAELCTAVFKDVQTP